ncbi:MAG: sugar phosphate isomerase/epimerase family protein [Bacillota bacterium]
MQIAVVTDQISRDLDTACEQVASWGGRQVSLRVVGDGPVGSDLSSGFLDGLCATLEGWDLRVASIAPQAFKVGLEEPAMRYHRRILLPASLHLAVLLKSQTVQIGAPLKPADASGPVPEAALEVLAEAAELAGNLGLTLALENQIGTWADSAAATALIVKTVGHHALRIAWDPSTSALCGEEVMAAYRAVQRHLHAVRVRDIRLQGNGFSPVLPGDGQAGLLELMRALAAHEFPGAILLDPGLTPRLEGARAAYETLEKQLQTALRAVRSLG